jgi:hypothetical protein
MDSKKKKLQEEVAISLQILHRTIDSLKEKVDKLCESTGCFKSPKNTENDKK